MRTILISDGAQPKGVRGATSLDVLKGVLVMKKVIQLNSAMPRTVNTGNTTRTAITTEAAVHGSRRNLNPRATGVLEGCEPSDVMPGAVYRKLRLC